MSKFLDACIPLCLHACLYALHSTGKAGWLPICLHIYYFMQLSSILRCHKQQWAAETRDKRVSRNIKVSGSAVIINY